MPIYLPAVSRRRFLVRTLAAGAGMALSPKLFAATKRTDENSWALLSDLHLAANRAEVARGVNMADHFQTVSTEVLRLPKRPAGVLITGDCAFNSGQTGDYEFLANVLEPMRRDQLPIHLALGNHDNRERFWQAFEEEKAAKRPLADRQVAILPTKRVNWFIMDSLETTLSTPGLLGPAQLEWLAKALDANAGKPAIVVIHHNPGISGNMGLKDTVALFEIIRPRRQVKAYIYGHTHTWKVETEESGIHLVNLPPVAYLFHEGDPAGWVHATLEKQSMSLELRCVDTNHKNHGQKVDLKWRT
jgi:3',5'-cyclic AMP phosphodiesterase CpdA